MIGDDGAGSRMLSLAADLEAEADALEREGEMLVSSSALRSLPQRSQTMRRYQDGKAASGPSRASGPEGSGWSP